MQIAHANDTEWANPSQHRGPGIEFKRLLAGVDGAVDNYELALVRFPQTYTTPRHRHNYDQIRVAIDGDLNYAPGKQLTAGSVGYFPEGTPYGPQEVSTNPLTMAVQLGGAAGQGFFGYDSLARGYQELAELGEFHEGVWRGTDPDSGRTVNIDGYQAVWEHLSGRKMLYAPAAYAEPVIMFPQRPSPAAPAEVHVQHLGTFTAARTILSYAAVPSGASYTTTAGPAGQLLFVWSGRLHAGSGVLDALDGAHLAAGEAENLTAADGDVELLIIDLPQVTP